MASGVETVSVNKASRSPAKRSRGLLFGTIVVFSGIAASVAALAAVTTMRTAATSLAESRDHGLKASLGLQPILREQPPEREVRVAKFSRLTPTPADRIWPAGLTAAAIRSSHEKTTAIAAALASKARAEEDNSQALAAARARVETEAVSVAAASADGPSPLATALAPTTSAADAFGPPFALVLADRSPPLPATIPLPLSRPRNLADADGGATRGQKPAARELAYAKPGMPALNDKGEDEVRPSFRGRKGVAYYDISAGKVYMPNGERLEAHSGIGKMRDNPDYAHVKMKGPTPPGTYKVTMREALFHGVEAVRLTPTNGIAPHGRVGLLAHSYLLRTPGDSHGCVAFADYPRFLRAFKRGEITHMVIVDSIEDEIKPTRTLASLFSRGK